jgi:hypothetical protein
MYTLDHLSIDPDYTVRELNFVNFNFFRVNGNCVVILKSQERQKRSLDYSVNGTEGFCS